MNLFELVFSILLVVLVVVGSNGLGHILRIPGAVAVIPIIVVPAMLVRITGKLPGRTLMVLSVRLVVAALLAIAIAHVAGFKEAVVVPSGIAIFILVGFAAIQSKFLASGRRKQAERK